MLDSRLVDFAQSLVGTTHSRRRRHGGFSDAGYSVVSYRLGFTEGLGVTVFPMIIIAWTIERLSVAAEEQGSREALIQTAGSLVVASVCYLVMSNATVEHLVFNFPEINLLILTAILWVGIYRLSG